MLSIHSEQIAEHGGRTGLRDEGSLESALARAVNLFNYGTADLADLAAAYAYGLVRNHPFVDGNKRTSLVACLSFLDLNGLGCSTDDEAMIATWLSLAAGEMSEAELAAWLRTRIVPLG